jgi:uncharacterized RDD family membrane protein YckC
VTAVRPAREYGGIVTRAVAFLIDATIINVGTLLLGAGAALVASVIVPEGLDPGLGTVLAGLGTWWVAGAAYFVAFWTLTGQTAGMRVMRLGVSDAAGARLRLPRAVVRLVGMWLAAIPLMAGYALILFDDRRQGLHDKLAGTFVRHLTAGDAHPLDGTPARHLAAAGGGAADSG